MQACPELDPLSGGLYLVIPRHGIIILATGEPRHLPPNMESSVAVAGTDHVQWPILTRNHLVAASQLLENIVFS